MTRSILRIASFFIFVTTLLPAQSASTVMATPDEELKFVVYLIRHGIRSPTGIPEQYNTYSSAPWPAWSVPPGNLTAHGYRVMRIFGAYDHEQLSDERLLTATGCLDADRVTVYADSDQRTRETGHALAAGLFPDCSVPVHALPEGTPDPLFHPLEAGGFPANSALSVAAIKARVGGDPGNLSAIYHARLTDLDNILSKCGTPGTTNRKRMSILDIPAAASESRGSHPADLRGPLNTASTLTENLLLEYTEGMPNSDVGWGCVNGSNLRTLLELHVAAADFTQRTTAIAQLQASNLLDHIRRALQQAATGQAIAGAISRPNDRALFLIGHDTNLSELSGLLNLTWIADGRRDDTPPGAAIVFELWHSKASGADSVRAYYTAQTLEQMRSESTLTHTNPPMRTPLYLPGCSRANLSCELSSFIQTVNQAIDPRSVSPN